MINSYATLTDYKNFVTARGQTANISGADDAIIEDLLENASRYIDGETARQFYPTVETRLYDIPDNLLFLDADLLELTTLTNGDATVITSTDYILHSPNKTPYWGISLRDISTVFWDINSSGSAQQVISVAGVWGYCEKYSQRGWKSAGTLGAAMTDTTTLAFTLTAGHSLVAGNIVKIGSEIMNLDSVTTTGATPYSRGDNGSTAATHLINSVVYVWVPDPRARLAVLDQTNLDYDMRFGTNKTQGTQTATEVKLKGSSRMMRDFIELMRRKQ